MLIEQRDSLRGEINIPGDKSISHRAVVIGSLAKGDTEIDGFLLGEDCLSTIDCFRKMQISIEILSSNKIKVHGKGLYGLKPPTNPLNTGRSGTSARLILGVMSGQPFNSILTRGDLSIKKPLGPVVNYLKQMGATINGRDEKYHFPLSVIPSNLKGVEHNLSANESHIKSPLLLAGLYSEGTTTVIEEIRSRDHSELMLKSFGSDITVDDLKVSIKKNENLYAEHIIVPGDFSIAAYFITAGLLVPNSDITIKNVGINPTRTGLLDVYQQMGANIEITNIRTISNEKLADIRVTSSNLKSITIEGDLVSRLIDEIPILMIATAIASGTTTIKSLKGTKIKNSSRLKDLIGELSKMGARIQETDDGMVIDGGKTLKGSIIESHNDYAIAMSMSVAGLIATGETMIRKAQIVDVVFPDFLPILNNL